MVRFGGDGGLSKDSDVLEIRDANGARLAFAQGADGKIVVVLPSDVSGISEITSEDESVEITADGTVRDLSVSGGSQTLAQVLTEGNDADNNKITNLTPGDAPGDAVEFSQFDAAVPTADQKAALDAAAAPDGSNPFATMADLETPTLAAVLAEGSDGGGAGMTNTGAVATGGADIDTGGGGLNTGGGGIALGGAPVSGVDNPNSDDDAVNRGWANAHVNGLLVADANDGEIPVVSGGMLGFNTLAVIVDAGVPVAAPTAGQLPFYYDTTAVTGGFYFWNGAAWVKVATIL